MEYAEQLYKECLRDTPIVSWESYVGVKRRLANGYSSDPKYQRHDTEGTGEIC